VTRAERLGLGGAAVGHAALIAALSLGLFAAPKPDIPKSQPVDVQLVDDVGATDTAPVVSTEPPAASVAPELGPPEEASPAPQPTPAPPMPTPPVMKAPPAAARPAPPRISPAPSPVKPAPRAATPPAPKQATAKGGRLGSNFLKGIVDSDQPGEAAAPRAQIGPAQLAGLASAIRRQVQPCANRIVSPGPGAEDIVTKLNLQMRPDGNFAAEPRIVGQTTNADNARYATRVGELARAAFRQCAPFELPAELYDGWKNINLNYRLPA
jgi:outer membrane biosynthesis protein TonB